MGAYFIAAGSKSRSRDTLERPTAAAVLEPVLADDVLADLRACFAGGESIHVWGAMEGGRSALEQLNRGDYVVDVNGAEIVQVFEFAFSFKPHDTRLQEALGWADGGAKPFVYVMFLRRPRTPRESHRDKSYFQHAFAFDKANWLSRSRYFDAEILAAALARCEVDTVEDLLGIDVAPVQIDATPAARAEDHASAQAAIDSRQARRQALLAEVQSDWHNARVNLLDASAKLLELATRALKKVDERVSRNRDAGS
ncbi:MAG: hypothetical protein V3U43_00520 [Pseudomonadales bacterium]